MCAIAGAVFWRNVPRDVDPVTVVSLMTDAQAHRGPDGRGVTLCGAPSAGPVAALGHRRLAILDLSGRAAQPMQGVRRRVWLTYNGEVYNFPALRRELERAGHLFRSNSDTEVVLRGYEEWGLAVVDRLRGMFAFAVWDGDTGRLTLVRDRLGIKPLYVHATPERVLFASEIRALLASGLVPRDLDIDGVDEFLACQTTPSPRTLIRGVKQLPPGHTLTLDDRGQFHPRPYWDLLDSRSLESRFDTVEDARTQVGERLLEATSLHLVSDVPVGVFLSGGIDSSAIVALVRASGSTPHTFAVTFPDTPYDEGPYAHAVARAFDADHLEIPLRAEDICEDMASALQVVDHPSGDGMNTYVVSRAVQAAGIKVALSGLGGDELFGGYPSFARLSRLAGYGPALRRSPAPIRRAAASALKMVGGSTVASAKAAALLESDGTLAQAFPILRRLFSPGERAALLKRTPSETEPYGSLLEAADARRGDAGLMALVSYAETRTYTHDVLLRDTDQMSMSHGLEVRVPLLDHRVVEYVMGLPDAVKRHGQISKSLLVDSLPQRLPAECVHRPKRGFVLPFDRWMRGDLKSLCERHLGVRGLQRYSFIRPGGVDRLWTAFVAAKGTTSWTRPWALVALAAWLEKNGINEP